MYPPSKGFKRVFMINVFFTTLCSSVLAKVGGSFLGADYVLFYLCVLFLVPYKLKNYKTKASFFGLMFVVFCAYIALNAWMSPYEDSIFWAFVGGLLILMIPIINFLYKETFQTQSDIIQLLKFTSIISAILIIAIYIEYFTIGPKGDEVHKGTLRGISSLFKDGGLAASFLNISIIVNLALFKITKKVPYLILIFCAMATVLLLLFIKSIIVMVAILACYYFIFMKGRLPIKMLFVSAFLAAAVIAIASITVLSDKFETYYQRYVSDATSHDVAPRNALYITSGQIASDMFPLGTGVGTFGSYPVTKDYGEVYYHYGLNHTWGLTKPMPGHPNFLLDTYWPSVLGELGVLGTIIFLYFYFTPVYRLLKVKNLRKEDYIYSFIIILTTMVVTIESISLSIATQVNMIFIIAGLNNMIVNYLKFGLVKVQAFSVNA